MKKLFTGIANFFKGMVLGLANIIPGVSGGTMAVAMNCYDEYVETLGLRNLKKNLFFLITAGLGMLTAIVIFSIVASGLIKNYPVASALTFVGLIAGSLPLIVTHTRKAARKLGLIHFLCFTAGLAVMIGMTFLNADHDGTVYSFDAPHGLLLVVMMALSAFTMLIPGVSGSLLMKVLGAYDTITDSIGTVSKGLLGMEGGDASRWPFLVAVIAGAAIGLLFGSRLVSFLLKKCSGPTYCLILGLVVGSLLPILKPLSFALGAELYIGIACCLAGAAMAYFFGRTETH